MATLLLLARRNWSIIGDSSFSVQAFVNDEFSGREIVGKRLEEQSGTVLEPAVQLGVCANGPAVVRLTANLKVNGMANSLKPHDQPHDQSVALDALSVIENVDVAKTPFLRNLCAISVRIDTRICIYISLFRTHVFLRVSLNMTTCLPLKFAHYHASTSEFRYAMATCRIDALELNNQRLASRWPRECDNCARSSVRRCRPAHNGCTGTWSFQVVEKVRLHCCRRPISR